MRVSCVFLMAALACAGAEAPAQAPRSDDRPRLLVMIVADQMSDDLLDRYGPYMRGGFRRLLDSGRRFTGATVDHAPTNSLPGHLTVATGAHPRRHGIIDNNWIEQRDGSPVRVLGFSDPDCPANAVRGTPRERAGADAGMGPGRFESPTIVEWVLAADPRARFASVGTGGGVAVLHAGKVEGPVLWYDAGTGGFITSSCYAAEVPGWAEAVNSRIDSEFVEDWVLAAPPAMVELAGADSAPHENGGEGFVFPHRAPVDGEARRRWLLATPFADRATLVLAEAAVVGEALGADEVTDILTIGLSTLDHVGHSFGPTSVEQADTLFRMDRNLGAFFDFLDRRVGAGRWTLALSADHGAPPAPEEAQRLGIGEARRIPVAQVEAGIEVIVAAGDSASDADAAAKAAAKAAGKLDFVARVITAQDQQEPGDEIERLYANSYRPGRTSLHPLYQSESGRSAAEFGIIVVPPPYAVVDWAASIHGSPYAYDREVELIFYGAGVAPGVVAGPSRTIDVAPTLAAIAAIRPLGPIDGEPLQLR